MLKSELLSIRPTVQPVDLPHGTIYVRELSVADAIGLRKCCAERPHDADPFLFAVSACSADGVPLFSHESDLPAINALPASLVRKVVEAALALNGLADSKKN